MAAPTPSVTVIKLQEESFVYSSSEAASDSVGAVFAEKVNATGATASLLTTFGTTSDVSEGYRTVKTVTEWINTYINTYKGLCAGIAVKSPNPSGTGKACTETGAGSTCFNGATGVLATQWWGVHNFLQYGGPCFVAGDTNTYSKNLNPLMDKSKLAKIDVVFALDHTKDQADIVTSVVNGRGNDCFGVVGVSGAMSGGYGEFVAGYGGQTSTGVTGWGAAQGASLGQYGILMFGQKQHFGLLDGDLTLITTPLMADAAGCIVRTDRDYGQWWSPAGYIRGRILNVLRLKDVPSDASQQDLYRKRINYAITNPGQGSFLFSDRTSIADDASAYRVSSVSRMVTYLVNQIGPLAKKFLFEFNNEITRSSFVNSATPILEYVRSTGGLTSYKLVCDETNNPEDVVLNNEFVVDIVLKPTTPITTLTLRFTNANVPTNVAV